MDLCFVFSLRLLSCLGVKVLFSLFFCLVLLFGGPGEKEMLWDPHYDRASWSEGRKGVYRRKKAVVFLVSDSEG